MISVEVNNISRSFNGVAAVRDMSLTVERGALFGLIGPDGAGKTTLFRMLTTLLLPDSGTATVDGFDVVTGARAIRQRVGYMPGKFSLYQDLTVEENLSFFAALFGTTIQENYHLISDIYSQIEPFKKRRAGKLSGGMKQKLALSCALIHKPTVLFLDEPTTGVDAVSRKEFWEMLKRLKAQDITIIVSTPYMDEATLCDRIGLIQNGSLLSVDTPDNIIHSYPESLYAIRADDMYQLLKDLRGYENTKSCFAFGEFLHLSFLSPHPENEERLVAYLRAKRHSNIEFLPVRPTVEDCFMRLLNEHHA